MAKKLAGKRWFEAQGRRAKAKGVSVVPKPIGSRLPRWAQSAFSRGWFQEYYASADAIQRDRRAPIPEFDEHQPR